MQEGKRILVLEDERRWQRELSRLLEDEGYEVSLTDKYDHAVELVRSRNMLVAVVDVSLIPGDGYDRQGIRFMEGAGIPVVCVSGYLREEEVNEMIRTGNAEWFFSKQTFAGNEQQFLDAVEYAMTVSQHEIIGRWEALEARMISHRRD